MAGYGAEAGSGYSTREYELLRKLDSMFVSALDHPTWRSWRENATKCHRYRQGDQWTQEEKNVHADRQQPDTVNNQVSVVVDRMVGQFTQMRTRTKFAGTNAVDDPGAAALDDIFRFVRRDNQLEYEEKEVFTEGAISGFGCFYVFVEFDASLRPRIRVRALDALAEAFPDPHSRHYDWNEDASFVDIAKWLTFDDAIAMYPDHADLFRGLAADTRAASSQGSVDAFNNRNYVDYDADGNPRRVRVVECWYKEVERTPILRIETPTGEVAYLPKSQAPALAELRALGVKWREIPNVTKRIKSATFTSWCLLDEQDEPHGGIQLYPVAPFYVERMKSGEPFSRILLSLTMQDAINFRESRALHLLNSRGALLGENAVADKAEFATELAKPDGLPTARNFEQVQLMDHVDMAVGQLQMHQAGMLAYRQITGVHEESLGERSEVRSGIGIAKKQEATNTILTGTYDNFRRTRGILGAVVEQFISAYIDEETAFTITDELDVARRIELKGDVIAAYQNGRYNVVIEDVPDSATVRQEQAALILPVLPQVAGLPPVWQKIFFSLAEIRDREAILKMLADAGAPPPPEPKINVAINWNDCTAEEKVAWAGKLGMQALAKAEQQNPQPTANEAKGELEEKKAAANMREESTRQLGEIHREGAKQDGARRIEDERSRRAVAVATVGAESRKAAGGGGGGK